MCRHIGLMFRKRLDTTLLRHRIRKYLASPSTGYRIRCGFIFPLWKADWKKYPDSLPNSLDACGRKPYPERKSSGFKNICTHAQVLENGPMVQGFLNISSTHFKTSLFFTFSAIVSKTMQVKRCTIINTPLLFNTLIQGVVPINSMHD